MMNRRKKKVLVTGASGFLGSHICEAAHEAGYQVHALIRNTSSREWLNHGWITIHVSELDDRKSLSQIIEGMDYVIHAAGVMATTSRNPRDSHRVNLELTRLLAESSAEAGVRRFVFCSSLAAGGPGPDPRPRTEDDPDNPVSHYGRSKLAAEQMLAAFSDLSTVSLRFSMIYGPRDRNIFGFFKAASGKVIPLMGCNTLHTSMVYGPDAARAAIAALAADIKSGSVYQITDGVGYTLNELYDYMEQALGKAEKGKRLRFPFWLVMLKAWWNHDILRVRGISPDQVRQFRALYWKASCEKAIRELGWKPEVDFKEGLAMTVKWYRNHNWLP
jgi:nucleoside-diphosphate-sugar epimerase